jgi:hypothetical protein
VGCRLRDSPKRDGPGFPCGDSDSRAQHKPDGRSLAWLAALTRYAAHILGPVRHGKADAETVSLRGSTRRPAERPTLGIALPAVEAGAEAALEDLQFRLVI